MVSMVELGVNEHEYLICFFNVCTNHKSYHIPLNFWKVLPNDAYLVIFFEIALI